MSGRLDDLCVSVIALKPYLLSVEIYRLNLYSPPSLITDKFSFPSSCCYFVDLTIMSLSISIGRKLLYLGLLARVTLTQDNPCITFGVDFQDGGSYFQNSLSTSPFTFVQEFEGGYCLWPMI